MGNEHFDRATRMILEALQADSRLSNQALVATFEEEWGRVR